MIALKRTVTKYFNARKLLLQTMGKKGIKKSDDWFELYVLTRLLILSHVVSFENTRKVGAKTYFVIATAPSPDWVAASYAVCGKTGSTALRSGLQVHDQYELLAELDITAVRLPVPGKEIKKNQVIAALECKTHTRKIDLSKADAVLGKASRLWQLPVLRIKKNGSRKFTVASLSEATQQALRAFNVNQVGFIRLKTPIFEQTLKQLTRDLKIRKTKPKKKKNAA